MRPIATAAAIRAAEQDFFTAHPGADLMGRAAEAVAASAADMLGHRCSGKHVLLAAGAGNNGGDGLFAVAALARQGADVAVWASGDTLHEAGRCAVENAGCRFVDTAEALQALAETDLLVDAVFGIGGRPGLRDATAVLAAEAEALGVPVLAVDLPSGLAADSHRVEGTTFRATRTVTFIAEKMCHVAQPAAARCGEVQLVDIGVPAPATDVQAATLADVARAWPWPGSESDKYSRGVVGIDTGSDEYTGAAVLGSTGAVFSGAGMVRYAGPERPSDLVRALLPSVVHGSGRVQAWVCGSGWGSADGSRDRLDARLGDGVPVLVDADALALLDGVELPHNSLLTPHAGELARMLGVERDAVQDAPLDHVREAARRFGATVLLKGATQYAARPEGRVTLAVAGPSWTAQAGSGDTLAGACGTLLAAGLDADTAAVLGASLQALTASRHPGPLPPDVLARHFADTIAWLESLARRAGAAS